MELVSGYKKKKTLLLFFILFLAKICQLNLMNECFTTDLDELYVYSSIIHTHIHTLFDYLSKKYLISLLHSIYIPHFFILILIYTQIKR